MKNKTKLKGYQKTLPKHTAFNDIQKEIKRMVSLDVFHKNHEKSKDVWTYSPYKLDNKETRRLNRQLGIHKINK